MVAATWSETSVLIYQTVRKLRHKSLASALLPPWKKNFLLSYDVSKFGVFTQADEHKIYKSKYV